MAFTSSSIKIMGGGFLVILTTLQYVRDPTYPYNVPLILFFLIFFNMGILEIRESFNRTLYFLNVVIFLSLMWVGSLFQPSSGDAKIWYFIENGILTAVVITLLVETIQRLNKNENQLKPYNKALSVNPNDTTALNNKGVELAVQTKYKKAMACFNKIMEIYPEDSTAQNNRNLIKPYAEHRTVANYLEKGPHLEITVKSGKKLILSIKKK